MSNPELSIVIPTYNESEIIRSSLENIALFLASNPIDAEVIVADTSTDSTEEEASVGYGLFDRFSYINAGNRRGKGWNVFKGITQSNGDYRFFIDADLSTPPHHLNTAMEQLKEGADVVIGERDYSSFLSGLELLMATLGNKAVQMTMLPGISDTQCGFKGFTKSAAESVLSRQKIWSWGFDIELLNIAHRAGFLIKSLPIEDYNYTVREQFHRNDNKLKVDLQLTYAYLRTLLRKL